MKLNRFIESLEYHNIDITYNEWRDLMSGKHQVDVSKDDIKQITDYFSKLEINYKKSDLVEVIRINEYESDPRLSSGIGMLSIRINGLTNRQLLITKNDDDWYLIYNRTYSINDKVSYNRCDSIEGLFIKLDQILNYKKSDPEFRKNRDEVVNKVKKMNSDQILKLKDYINTI